MRFAVASVVFLLCLVTGDLRGQCVLWVMLIFSLMLVGKAVKAMEGGR